MKKLFLSFFILYFFSFLFIGCASVGRKVDMSQLEKIKTGETTQKEVLRLIGSPDQITKDGRGNITMQYIYARASTRPETFIPVVGSFVGGQDIENQTVMIIIGPDGKVKDVISSYGASEVDRGLSTGSKAEMKEVKEDKRKK